MRRLPREAEPEVGHAREGPAVALRVGERLGRGQSQGLVVEVEGHRAVLKKACWPRRWALPTTFRPEAVISFSEGTRKHGAPPAGDTDPCLWLSETSRPVLRSPSARASAMSP